MGQAFKDPVSAARDLSGFGKRTIWPVTRRALGGGSGGAAPFRTCERASCCAHFGSGPLAFDNWRGMNTAMFWRWPSWVGRAAQTARRFHHREKGAIIQAAWRLRVAPPMRRFGPCPWRQQVLRWRPRWAKPCKDFGERSALARQSLSLRLRRRGRRREDAADGGPAVPRGCSSIFWSCAACPPAARVSACRASASHRPSGQKQTECNGVNNFVTVAFALQQCPAFRSIVSK